MKRMDEALRNLGLSPVSLITQLEGDTTVHRRKRKRSEPDAALPPRRSTRERTTVSYKGMDEENTGFALASLLPRAARRRNRGFPFDNPPEGRKFRCRFLHNLWTPKGFVWACDPPKSKNKKDGGEGTKVRSARGVFFDNEEDCAKDYDKWARSPAGISRAKRDKHGKLLVNYPCDLTTEAQLRRRSWLPHEIQETQEVYGQPATADDVFEWNASSEGASGNDAEVGFYAGINDSNASVAAGNDSEVNFYTGGHDLNASVGFGSDAEVGFHAGGLNAAANLNGSGSVFDAWANDDSAGDISPVDDSPSSPSSSAMWTSIEPVNEMDRSPGLKCGLSDGNALLPAAEDHEATTLDVDSLLTVPPDSPAAPAAAASTSTALEQPAQAAANVERLHAAKKPAAHRFVLRPTDNKAAVETTGRVPPLGLYRRFAGTLPAQQQSELAANGFVIVDDEVSDKAFVKDLHRFAVNTPCSALTNQYDRLRAVSDAIVDDDSMTAEDRQLVNRLLDSFTHMAAKYTSVQEMQCETLTAIKRGRYVSGDAAESGAALQSLHRDIHQDNCIMVMKPCTDEYTLRVIPKSHLWDVTCPVDESAAITVTAQTGQTILWDGLLVHSGGEGHGLSLHAYMLPYNRDTDLYAVDGSVRSFTLTVIDQVAKLKTKYEQLYGRVPMGRKANEPIWLQQKIAAAAPAKQCQQATQSTRQPRPTKPLKRIQKSAPLSQSQQFTWTKLDKALFDLQHVSTAPKDEVWAEHAKVLSTQFKVRIHAKDIKARWHFFKNHFFTLAFSKR